MDLEIVCFATKSLRPYERKLRVNDHAVSRMADAIQQFGFKIPILIRGNGEIIDGHLRYKAALKLGLEEVPVIVCDDLSPAQLKAFRLLVNRSATWAEWDLEELALEIEELAKLDIDLAFTGFDASEIDKLRFRPDFGEDAEPNIEPPESPVSRLGDTWLCGAHRVRCGDSTCSEDVALLLAPGQPVLMVSDPPYGTEYNPMWRQEAGLGRQRQTGVVTNDDRADWTAAYKLFPGNVAYIWHAGVHGDVVAAGLKAASFAIRCQIIWAKQNFALSRGDYHWQHEPCLYAVREGKSSNWCGDRKQSTVWQVANLNPIGGNRDEEATGHGTQKPIEVMRRPILNHTAPGEIVYDPFLGSGTTLIAAELTERVCYGLEIEPAYVDMIVQRWQQRTGKQATLESDGRTFEEVLNQRRVQDQNPSEEGATAEEVSDAAAI